MDKAIVELEKSPGLRPDTLRNYRTVIRVFRSLIPDPPGPAAVTTTEATRFERLYLSGRTKRGNRPTSPVSCRTYLRTLRSLWSLHFKELGVVGDNPWLLVKYPDVPDKDVVVPEEDPFDSFYNWLDARYPAGPLIKLFVRVKGLSACRTLDLCSVKSNQLKGGKLTFTVENTKTKKVRTVPLPQDVYDQLDRIKGRVYLWESYIEGAKRFRPGPRTPDQFNPRAIYWGVSNIFREYNEAHPNARAKPHDLRKRGITLTTLATQNVEVTANAIGIDPQTARRYYTDAKKAFNADAIMNKTATALGSEKNVTKLWTNGGKTRHSGKNGVRSEMSGNPSNTRDCLKSGGIDGGRINQRLIIY